MTSPSHEYIYEECQRCHQVDYRQRWKIDRACREHNGIYYCGPCRVKIHFEQGVKDETKQKLREGRLGRSHSEETKQKMRDAKIKFYKTSQGEDVRKTLSKLTASKQNLLNGSKRRGYYFSRKMNKLMVYGSSYELRFYWLLDQNPNVKGYRTQVLYITEEGRGRALDFLIYYNDTHQPHAVEIKPHRQLHWTQNVEQINDSRANAIKNGWSFSVYTEEYFGMNEVQIRKWADEYRSQNSDIDYVALRKQKENEKVKRHYDKNIAANKVSFYCEYCKEDHETLKINYDRNITKNGRFICIKENGAITGKKSSNKKENPYASEGKKQCTKCNEIKLFEEFGFDKSRSDGYANRCKGCRSKGVKKCI